MRGFKRGCIYGTLDATSPQSLESLNRSRSNFSLGTLKIKPLCISYLFLRLTYLIYSLGILK